MEENFKVSSKSVDSGRWNTQYNYLWKSQTKANRELLQSWPFHIILNRKVKPVNHAYDMLVTYVFDSVIFGTFILHLNLC